MYNAPADILGIELIEGEYDIDGWMRAVKGLEMEPEKGARCSVCFDRRFEVSAEMAKSIGESSFTSTLLVSPKKSIEQLRRVGDALADRYGIRFIASQELNRKKGVLGNLQGGQEIILWGKRRGLKASLLGAGDLNFGWGLVFLLGVSRITRKEGPNRAGRPFGPEWKLIWLTPYFSQTRLLRRPLDFPISGRLLRIYQGLFIRGEKGLRGFGKKDRRVNWRLFGIFFQNEGRIFSFKNLWEGPLGRGYLPPFP